MDPKKRQRIERFDMTRVKNAIDEAFTAASKSAEQLAELRDIVALLDALSRIKPPANVLVQLHDYNGAIIAAAQAWAQDENVQHVYGLRPGYCAANLEVRLAPGIVVIVHDMRTYQEPEREIENVGGDWSPAQMAVSP